MLKEAFGYNALCLTKTYISVSEKGQMSDTDDDHFG
jgi:hypothetical protein